MKNLLPNEIINLRQQQMLVKQQQQQQLLNSQLAAAGVATGRGPAGLVPQQVHLVSGLFPHSFICRVRGLQVAGVVPPGAAVRGGVPVYPAAAAAMLQAGQQPQQSAQQLAARAMAAGRGVPAAVPLPLSMPLGVPAAAGMAIAPAPAAAAPVPAPSPVPIMAAAAASQQQEPKRKSRSAQVAPPVVGASVPPAVALSVSGRPDPRCASFVFVVSCLISSLSSGMRCCAVCSRASPVPMAMAGLPPVVQQQQQQAVAAAAAGRGMLMQNSMTLSAWLQNLKQLPMAPASAAPPAAPAVVAAIGRGSVAPMVCSCCVWIVLNGNVLLFVCAMRCYGSSGVLQVHPGVSGAPPAAAAAGAAPVPMELTESTDVEAHLKQVINMRPSLKKEIVEILQRKDSNQAEKIKILASLFRESTQQSGASSSSSSSSSGPAPAP